MRTTGVVRLWSNEDGWGVIDSPETPGGCWTHASVVAGLTRLRPGAPVLLEAEEGAQDGFDFRAIQVWPSATPVRVFPAAELVTSDPTAGMVRRRAFELPMLWAGQVETAPGAVSGWHHHDVNESCLYVVRGILRLEFEGHEGWIDAGPGDFVHVPAFTVHRETNPTDLTSLAVIARIGGGVPTVNVDAPDGRG